MGDRALDRAGPRRASPLPGRTVQPRRPWLDTKAPVEQTAWRLKTKYGRTRYEERKSTIEPVFGIIKSVMGFRQFSLLALAAYQRAGARGPALRSQAANVLQLA